MSSGIFLRRISWTGAGGAPDRRMGRADGLCSVLKVHRGCDGVASIERDEEAANIDHGEATAHLSWKSEASSEPGDLQEEAEILLHRDSIEGNEEADRSAASAKPLDRISPGATRGAEELTIRLDRLEKQYTA
jgi:hypothetical protein